LTLGKLPWTLHTKHPDNEATDLASQHSPIDYPKPDGVSTFDLPSSLYRSGTNHDHDQPVHLQLRDPGLPEVVNKARYDGPEGRCAGGTAGAGAAAVQPGHLGPGAPVPRTCAPVRHERPGAVQQPATPDFSSAQCNQLRIQDECSVLPPRVACN
jgi:hypothetical protein